jgi:hypothetical protein
MLRIDGAYIYNLVANLRPLSDLPEELCTRIDIYLPCVNAKKSLQEFLFSSVYRDGFRATAAAAPPLINMLEFFAPEVEESTNWDDKFAAWQVNRLKVSFSKFEAVLTADLQSSALFYVSSKGGYDTLYLTEQGHVLFPSSLNQKAPEALEDVRAATRCIAFELPTAAAFHLHRANEAVLRRYFDHFAGADKRPASGNMGDLLKYLVNQKLGDPRVTSTLQAIKDLHRNPIMHPDQIIESVEEAISLLAAVRSAIGYMLDRLPTEPEASLPLPFEP